MHSLRGGATYQQMGDAIKRARTKKDTHKTHAYAHTLWPAAYMALSWCS
jgi:hypothetical protein